MKASPGIIVTELIILELCLASANLIAEFILFLIASRFLTPLRAANLVTSSVSRSPLYLSKKESVSSSSFSKSSSTCALVGNAS